MLILIIISNHLFYIRFLKKCIYHEDGCKIQTVESELENHTSICEFKPINCFFANCNEKARLNKLLGHFPFRQ